MLVLFSLKHLFVRLRTFCVMHFQRTFLGKGESKGTPLEPRQGRTPAPPFPNRSLDDGPFWEKGKARGRPLNPGRGEPLHPRSLTGPLTTDLFGKRGKQGD